MIALVAVAGVPPRIMGIGPVSATAKVLRRAGIAFKDLDVIELNEAFAAQTLSVYRNGASMAMIRGSIPTAAPSPSGHPLGCSGARHPDDLAV